MKNFLVILKNGMTIEIQAFGFGLSNMLERHVIFFLISETEEIPDIYLPVEEVVCVIPKEYAVEAK